MISLQLRTLVRERAGDCCEYCQLSQQADDVSRFHIEHIIAIQHGGEGKADNLALSCHHCNLHKGPNLTGIDPQSGQIIPLFHPRRDVWEEHFRVTSGEVSGRTPTGRATIAVLAMIDEDRVALRLLVG
jgi:5-methylcytosine-specific restriction endonuclease McrA